MGKDKTWPCSSTADDDEYEAGSTLCKAINQKDARTSMVVAVAQMQEDKEGKKQEEGVATRTVDIFSAKALEVGSCQTLNPKPGLRCRAP